MKKYSDIFSGYKAAINQVGRRMATTALFMVAAITMAMGQEPYSFIEGSVHKFNVADNPKNTFAWSMAVDPYNNVDLDPSAYDLIDGGQSANLTIRFNDMGRTNPELVYLVAEETAPNGCSTRRALKIIIEPNNMYLDFASLPNADDCYNNNNNYFAEVQVGMNFKDRRGATDSAIPESKFPLRVKYTVENKTLAPGVIVQGNGGDYVVIDYKPDNNYLLEVSEAKGLIDRTIEYELAITEVVDKYDTKITHDENRRVQIRIMQHLPQSGGMDMALAYMLTPINYFGASE